MDMTQADLKKIHLAEAGLEEAEMNIDPGDASYSVTECVDLGGLQNLSVPHSSPL